MVMRFDRFTEEAQKAAQLSAEIIEKYGHTAIDTEHFLLALIEQKGGKVRQILSRLNIEYVDLWERINTTLRKSPKVNIAGAKAGQIFITPRVKRIIEIADDESHRLDDESISTEHLFLAILTEKQTPAARILESAELTHNKVLNLIKETRKKKKNSSRQSKSKADTAISKSDSRRATMSLLFMDMMKK